MKAAKLAVDKPDVSSEHPLLPFRLKILDVAVEVVDVMRLDSHRLMRALQLLRKAITKYGLPEVRRAVEVAADIDQRFSNRLLRLLRDLADWYAFLAMPVEGGDHRSSGSSATRQDHGVSQSLSSSPGRHRLPRDARVYWIWNEAGRLRGKVVREGGWWVIDVVDGSAIILDRFRTLRDVRRYMRRHDWGPLRRSRTRAVSKCMENGCG